MQIAAILCWYIYLWQNAKIKNMFYRLCLDTFLATQRGHGACCLLDDGPVGIHLLVPLGWVNAELYGHAFPKQLAFWPTCPTMKSSAWLCCAGGTKLGLVSHQIGNEPAHTCGGSLPACPPSGSLVSCFPIRHLWQRHKLCQPTMAAAAMVSRGKSRCTRVEKGFPKRSHNL